MLLNSYTMSRYLDNALRATLSSDPSFFWCMSGTCDYGQLHSGGVIFKCGACEYRACIACSVPWHTGETCAEYKARLKTEQRATKRLAKQGFWIRPLINQTIDKAGKVRSRLEVEEVEAKKTLKKVSKLCPGCGRKVQKDG